MRASVSVVARPLDVDSLLEAIDEAARARGIETYLVGGVVRDRLLGASDLREIDLVTVGGDGAELLAELARRLGWGPPTRFEHVGTAQVRGQGFVVEAVRARVERYDPESRTPAVRPGTLEEDVWRRDFTVNALVQTLSGRVLDITGRGLADLRAGILRTPLDPRETFSEDPLRMLRAARFVAQLGFRLADGMLEAMRETAERARILSPERVAEELRRLLVSPHPAAGMRVLAASGLLRVLLPEIAAMEGVPQSGYHIYDVLEHTLVALDASPPDLLTRLGVLFHDVGKPPTHQVAPDGRHTFHDHPAVGAEITEAVLRRLRFSNDEVRDVTRLVALHLRPIQYQPETFSDAAVRRLIRDAGPLRDRLLDVARADTRASAFPDTHGIDDLAERMARLDREGKVARRTLPLSGHDIMRIAGRGPGPWVGRVQRLLDEAVLDGTLSPDDAEAAERWLRERLAADPSLLAEDPPRHRRRLEGEATSGRGPRGRREGSQTTTSNSLARRG